MTLALASCGRSGLYELAGTSLQPVAPEARVPATLELRVDDFFSVWVGGEHLKTSTDLWHTPQKLSLEVRCGENVIAIEARNQWKTDGLDRGAIAQLTVGDLVVVTDDSWKHGDGPEWTGLGFDDRGWRQAVVIASHGAPPWGAVLGASTAKWVWSGPVGGPATGKVEVETVKLRKTFVAGCR